MLPNGQVCVPSSIAHACSCLIFAQVWKPQLLLLCFASKILTEANSLLNLQVRTAGVGFARNRPQLPTAYAALAKQDNSARQMASRQKVPPLPFLLSSLITSRPPRKVGCQCPLA